MASKPSNSTSELPWNVNPSTDSDNAPKDPRIQNTEFNQQFTENDFEKHRTSTGYISVPNDRKLSLQRVRSICNQEDDKEKDSDQFQKPISSAAQRVQDLLAEDVSKYESRALFSQMNELIQTNNEIAWRERARWLKFEETVDEGGNRWSKPHVATLSMQSLFELRNRLMNGSCVMDLDVHDWPLIVNSICDQFVGTDAVSIDLRDAIKAILMRPQHHQYEYYLKDERSSEGNQHYKRKIPHNAEVSNILVGEVDFLKTSISCFIRLSHAAVVSNLAEVTLPTRFIFVLLGPPGSQNDCHEIGRSMATLMTDEIFREVSYRARVREHLISGLDEFMDALTVLPPCEWDPSIRLEPPSSIPSQEMRKRPPVDPKSGEMVNDLEESLKRREETGLVFTGRLFGGLINDINRKAPWYLSDFRDALSMQTVASSVFLYFACLSPIITFGGLLAEATGNHMAAMESLVSAFVCGIGFGLFSGQPLNILGSTGPVLIFEAIVYDFSIHMGWDCMTFRLWIGIWIAVICIILTAVDASALVCYITRFTEENFALLIAIIFIYEAIGNVIIIGTHFAVEPGIYDCVCTPPMDSNASILEYAKYSYDYCQLVGGVLVGSDCGRPPTENVFLMTALLCAGTYFLSTMLKNFKNALFFPSIVRQYISDFSVFIAICVMSYWDYAVGVNTHKLQVPSEMKPTLSTRGWVIPLLTDNNPWWSIVVAICPAILGTILIFLDQQITAVIVNRKENKLRKGCGYHLDLFVLSILIGICSLMGLPWMVAATVQSMSHVNSLKLQSECSAPGEKPQFLGVREQRVTHIVIFTTIGCSVPLTPLLRHIPLPVLFGVFLYMGLSSLGDLQFFDRILILFMPAKYQPDYIYLRKVPIKRVHLYTGIQLASLGVLWLIKSFSQTAILFPLMLVVMIGIRKCLDYVFTPHELKYLDDLMPQSKKRTESNDLEAGFMQRIFSCCRKKDSFEPKNGVQQNGNASAGGALIKSNALAANEKDCEAQSSLLR